MKKTMAVLLAALMMLALTVGCITEKEPDNEEIEEVFNEIEHVYITNNAVKVYQDDKIEKNGIGVLTASLARNEDESAQFALYFDETIENVRVTVGDVVNAAGETIDATVYRLYYYDLTSADIEKPGYIPDVLIPMYDGSDGKAANDTCTVEAGKNQGYFITLSASGTQTAGQYKGTVTVTYGADGKIEIPLRATVWDFEIPVTPTMETSFARGWCHGSYGEYDLTNDELNESAYETLARFRVNSGVVGNPYNWAGDEQEAWVKYIAEFLETHPVTTVFGIPLFGFVYEDYDWLDQLPTAIVNDERNLNLYQLLVKYDLVSKAFYYFIDEPSYGRKNVCSVQGTSMQIKQFAPGVRNIVTLNYDMYHNHGAEIDELNGWCPIITDVTEEWVRSKIEKGDSVWWYTCCAPDIPYPTYRQNDNLVAPRILHWMQKDYGVQGELYWAANLNAALENGAYSVLMNVWETLETAPAIYGDGALIVLGLNNDGITNHNGYCATLRLEGIRDGMEDYEYLTLMENKLAAFVTKYGLTKTADDLMETYYAPLYAATNDYNHDAETVLTMRDILAEDIVRTTDTFVNVTSAEDGKRVVEVYAASGLTVTADGLTFTETAQNGYSVYTATAENATDEVVDIKVGDETVRRIIGAFSSAEEQVNE